MDSRVSSIFSNEPEDPFEESHGYKLTPGQLEVMEANAGGLVDRMRVMEIMRRGARAVGKEMGNSGATNATMITKTDYQEDDDDSDPEERYDEEDLYQKMKESRMNALD